MSAAAGYFSRRERDSASNSLDIRPLVAHEVSIKIRSDIGGHPRFPGTREWAAPSASPTDWLQLVNQPQTEVEAAALRCCINRGRPFGDPNWVTDAAKRLGVRMHGSAPWKTEETIVRLPRLLVLSVFCSSLCSPDLVAVTFHPVSPFTLFGTDRGQNARKTYRFRKDWRVHEAMTYYTLYRYNFCWAVRTLRQRDEQGQWQLRTPAMAAGLADRVWSTREWVSFPTVQVA